MAKTYVLPPMDVTVQDKIVSDEFHPTRSKIRLSDELACRERQLISSLEAQGELYEALKELHIVVSEPEERPTELRASESSWRRWEDYDIRRAKAFANTRAALSRHQPTEKEK